MMVAAKVKHTHANAHAHARARTALSFFVRNALPAFNRVVEAVR